VLNRVEGIVMNIGKLMLFIALFCFMNNKNMESELQASKVSDLFTLVPNEILEEILFISINDKDWQKNFDTLKALIKVNKRFNVLTTGSKDLTNVARCLIFQSNCVTKPGHYYFRH
jgi:hypothetical protein